MQRHSRRRPRCASSVRASRPAFFAPKPQIFPHFQHKAPRGRRANAQRPRRKKFYSIFFKKSRIPKAEPLGQQKKAAPDIRPRRPIFIYSAARNQYALPQYTITLAGLPQQGHTSPICSCSKGMQRLDRPATSFIFSSQASSPHHIVLM